MKILNILERLIESPSFDDGDQYEISATEYLEELFEREFPSMKVIKQEVVRNRYNLLIKDEFPTELLIVNHIDTVQPVTGWLRDPLLSTREGGKVYGLGSSDTKGNIASFISALGEIKATKGLAILLYVDEEYGFLGMKKFTESKEAAELNPKYIMSLDGSGLALGNACRGLVEVKIVLEGRNGHSANPLSGASVNVGFIEIISELQNELAKLSSKSLGSPTLNIARMQGGTLVSKDVMNLTDQGNIIPDFLESIIEIRTIPGLDGEWLRLRLEELVGIKKLKLKKFEIKHDLNSYETNLDDLTEIEAVVKRQVTDFKRLDPSTFGYLDLAMLTDIYRDAVVFSFGGGTVGQAHSADEYVLLEDLNTLASVYTSLLLKLI